MNDVELADGWSRELDDHLRHWYGRVKIGPAAIARHIGKTEEQVRIRLHELKVLVWKERK